MRKVPDKHGEIPYIENNEILRDVQWKVDKMLDGVRRVMEGNVGWGRRNPLLILVQF